MSIDPARLHTLTVTEALAAFRTGETTPSALLAALIARIEQLDGRYRAVMDVMAAEAVPAAEAATAAYAAAAADGLPPLLGIPLLVKEQHDVAGCSATRGSQVRAGMVAAADHPIVARLRAAGAIPFARTTTPEFSCATFTQTAAWGTTRNPFNPQRTPGGSSGGSAAAVALGYAPLATASDIAGSTRIPAAFCGLPGFKTPYGRTPAVPPMNRDWYRGDHVLTRTVADAMLATGIIAGLDAAEPTTVPAPHPYPGRLPEPAGLRVAFSRDLGCYDVDPEVLAGAERAAETLAAAGCEVVEVDAGLSLTDITDASMAHYGHLLAGNMRRMAGERFDELEPYSRRFVELTEQYAARISLVESLALETRVQAAIAAAMEGYDALLTPTSAVASLAADDLHLGAFEGREFYWERHMTVPFNIANQRPVMAMPTGTADGSRGGADTGVPTSVQIVGQAHDDATVFALAAALEAGLPAPVAPAMRG